MSQKSEHCEECGRLVIRGRMYLLDFEKVYCSQSCLNIGAEKIKTQLAIIPDLLAACERALDRLKTFKGNSATIRILEDTIDKATLKDKS